MGYFRFQTDLVNIKNRFSIESTDLFFDNRSIFHSENMKVLFSTAISISWKYVEIYKSITICGEKNESSPEEESYRKISIFLRFIISFSYKMIFI